MATQVPFGELTTCDLGRGWVFEGGPGGTIGGEPINKLLHGGNQGGIRISGPEAEPNLLGLVSTLVHPEWPDAIDDAAGQVMYHGDNDTPGSDLLDHRGNRALQHLFARGFESEKERAAAPPFFVFSTANEPGLPSRSHRFHGLAVAGAPDLPEEDWLLAKWFRGAAGRYQNFMLTLTVLDVPVVPRSWVDHLVSGGDVRTHAPDAYLRWVDTADF